MTFRRRAWVLGLLILLAAPALSGCGKRANLVPPEGAPATSSRTYPTSESFLIANGVLRDPRIS